MSSKLIELYEYEMMKNKNKKFVNEIKRMIQNPVDIENILKKIGFTYEDDFKDNITNSDSSDFV